MRRPRPQTRRAEAPGAAVPAPRRRGRLARALPYAGLAMGLAILLYYPASEAFDAWRRGQVAERLDTESQQMGDADKDAELAQARSYNERLAGQTPELPADQILPYDRQLSPDGHDTAFAYVVIPKIGLRMPVYHGTSEAVLSAGVGHVEGTSLPVGGASTHAVLSAHSGMAQMRAFDDIRLLEEGDVFGVVTLGDTYCYRVTSTEVVWPDEVESLAIQPGQDLATLVTCTPYGVNDHRLLVHAARTPVPPGFLDEGPDAAAVVTNRRLWPAAAGVAVAAGLGVAGVARRHRRRRRAASGVSRAPAASRTLVARPTAPGASAAPSPPAPRETAPGTR